MLQKLLKLFIFSSSLLILFSCSNSQKISDSEKKWLLQNDSITVALYSYYPPYQYINEQGDIDGIFIDFLKFIEDKLDYKFKKKHYKEWSDLLNDVENNKIDIILEIQKTKKRESYLFFHESFFESPHVIVTRKDTPFVNTIEELNDNVITLPKDYAIVENLKHEHPTLNIVIDSNELKGLQKLNSGKYDAFIGSKAIVNYYIRHHNLTNLRINAEIDFSYNPGLAINKNNPILNQIISKTISNITKEEKKSLLDSWFYSTVIPFYLTARFWVLLSLLMLFLLILISSFNYYLKFKIKQKTEELRIAKDIAEESNRLKTNFINNIPQEIRTPMHGISELSEILIDENMTNDERKKYTQMIISSSNELITIIDNILEISKLQTKRHVVRLVEVNLHNVFQTLFSFYEVKANEKNIKLFLESNILDDQNLLLTDRPKLNKTLNLIIDNAIKFTEKGFVKISYKIVDTTLVITIQDTGLGMSESHLLSISESLAWNKKDVAYNYKGLGLGLTIAKKNMDLIYGTITVKSKKNVGSTFTVSVPYAAVKKLTTGSAQHKKEQISKVEKNIVLIAEDGETNFLFLKTILTKMVDYDFIIYRAKNGEEAVIICQENKNVDLVLMDIKMPIMNGYDATRIIKSIRPDLPVIAQTAYSVEEDVQKALAAGCDDFISKPIDKKILKPLLQKYFYASKSKNQDIT